MQTQRDDHEEQDEDDRGGGSRGPEVDRDGHQLIRNSDSNSNNSFIVSAYESFNIFGKKELASKRSISWADDKAPPATPQNGHHLQYNTR